MRLSTVLLCGSWDDCFENCLNQGGIRWLKRFSALKMQIALAYALLRRLLWKSRTSVICWWEDWFGHNFYKNLCVVEKTILWSLGLRSMYWSRQLIEKGFEYTTMHCWDECFEKSGLERWLALVDKTALKRIFIPFHALLGQLLWKGEDENSVRWSRKLSWKQLRQEAMRWSTELVWKRANDGLMRWLETLL